jgi:hypothetical protein
LVSASVENRLNCDAAESHKQESIKKSKSRLDHGQIEIFGNKNKESYKDGHFESPG